MTSNAIFAPALEGGFAALNPDAGTPTLRKTAEEVLRNLREPTDGHLEEFQMMANGTSLLTTIEAARWA